MVALGIRQRIRREHVKWSGERRRRQSARAIYQTRLRFEPLEDRSLLSVLPTSMDLSKSTNPHASDAGPFAHPTYVLFNSGSSATPADFASPPSFAFNPSQIKQAYGIDQILDGGSLQQGAGVTIAIIDAYDNPMFVSRNGNANVNQDAAFLASDLHQFDVQYGLPEPANFFTKVDQNGGTNYPTGDTGWGTEIALDVEWAHAIAPLAKIILIEATDNSYDNLLSGAGVWARDHSGASVVSMSFGGGEFAGMTGLDAVFHSPVDHGITWLASTGDWGEPSGYPAYSPNVVGVGGTTLTAPGGVYGSESGWSGSGGGISVYETQPGYQQGLVIHDGSSIISPNGMRSNPDISFDADPNSGVAVYDSYSQGSAAPWLVVGGTSFSSPAWAGLIAIADGIRANHGLRSLDGLNDTLPTLYSLYHSAQYASDFHDVTDGYNGYSAGVGYDLVTGIGTPRAEMLIPDLAGVTLRVTTSTPAIGAVVSTPPANYVITFSNAIDPASLAPSDLTVNSIAATGVTLSPDDMTATFTFSTNPVTTQGLQTMVMTAGAVAKLGDPTSTLKTFNGTFRYDIVTLQVTATTPPANSVLTLPGPFTYDVTFNEPVDPASVTTYSLVLSGISGRASPAPRCCQATQSHGLRSTSPRRGPSLPASPSAPSPISLATRARPIRPASSWTSARWRSPRR